MVKRESDALVSVIMPTFNRADFVCEAIESVLGQTYPNLELHVVDDGSTDETATLLKRYEQDERFHYHYQENQGQAVARNHGLREAKGDFISFIDSDNIWVADCLEIQLAIIQQKPDVDIVYGDLITINERGEELHRRNMGRHSGAIAKYLIRDNSVSHNTTLVRRACFDQLGGFNEQQRRADDYDLWLRFSARFKYLYVPEFFARYRVMENQISSDKDGRFSANKEILDRFHKSFPDAVTPRERRQGWAYFYARRARYLASEKRIFPALLDVGRSIVAWPFSQTPWRAFLRVFLPG